MALITLAQARKRLKLEIAKAGSATAWAKAKGVPPSLISEALTGRRPRIGPTLQKALKIKRVEMYEDR